MSIMMMMSVVCTAVVVVVVVGIVVWTGAGIRSRRSHSSCNSTTPRYYGRGGDNR